MGVNGPIVPREVLGLVMYFAKCPVSGWASLCSSRFTAVPSVNPLQIDAWRVFLMD
jgi:hypothetical protein